MTKPNRLSPFRRWIRGASALMIALVSTFTGYSLGEEAYVETNDSPGALALASDGKLATLYVDENDHWGLARAVEDLQADFGRVTGVEPRLLRTPKGIGPNAVIVGTLGKSQLIDQLVADGKIDPSGIADTWEGYHIELVEKPIDGVKQALVIAGSDKRGAIFGVYDLSEQIGVSPWYWWADVPAKESDTLFIKPGTRIQDAPKVKYRGIFLNDEAPALSGWVHENYGNFPHEFYVHVFELLLRLKSNFLWPAMWNNAFADDDPQNMILAHEYGIVMSTSHHEPMMRADKEWDRYGEGPWDYARNPDRLDEFWREGAERNKPYDSIYTIGMRGQADTPMSETEDIDLLEKIVDAQREILTEVFDDRDVTEVPQVWALYKEVQGYYESGMRVPDDVILLWCDDNWGNIRRLPTPEERERVGGAGVYYHFDYVGGPRSYRWINVTQLAKVWEQMNLADKYEANQIWLTNVGDLKPMEYPITYFLDLAWDIDDWPKERITEYPTLFAERNFGPKYAQEIGELLSGYSKHNARRKPELQSSDTYNLLHHKEADRILAEVEAMTQQAESLYEKIDPKYRDAFFQLVLYPTKASGVITRMYVAQGLNHLYAQQGRASTNEMADKVEELFDLNTELAEMYHKDIADGKWNHMMSQPRIGYTHWNNPPADTLPPVMRNRPAPVADMGVAVEGTAEAWPQEGVFYRLPEFHRYGDQNRFIEVFNKGTQPFMYTAEASEPWIQLSKDGGSVKDTVKVSVSIDWEQVPEGTSTGSILVRGTGWGGARIGVSATKPEAATLTGFIEANGYVSIDAANFSDKVDAQGLSWEIIPDLGRTDSSVAVFPVGDESFEDPSEAPYLEYDLTLFTEGEISIETLWSATWPIAPGRGLRFAIALDDEQPQIVDLHADRGHHLWQESVRNGNVRPAVTAHTVEDAGPHTLRIYMIDPAKTLQKIIINTGGLQPSYLGPEQSLHASDLN
ncbi:glycosyl hydrolase 115 family protein [Pelagicoccus sp. SDUM812003]|uniref:glycosyl hydrolase 115 family protein n=1 Tax=Pelagicoccus sp. SDUM812003 TaxID=3041267 RepID=UPI00280F2949|nr:glycosyl hydrolase 115 family protein [Pelagicoccus sp. SDUM812003]MDQ8203143.1 glycosyl hydrolase 115 family protein [Pelagicoccus sp. SDUM812003]